MSEESWEKTIASSDAARSKFLAVAMELGSELKYGNLLSDGAPDKWNNDLLGAQLSAADKEVRAAAMAMGVTMHLEMFLQRIDKFRAETEELFDDPDFDGPYTEGVVDALDFVQNVMGDPDPLALYERLLGMMYRRNEKPD